MLNFNLDFKVLNLNLDFEVQKCCSQAETKIRKKNIK